MSSQAGGVSGSGCGCGFGLGWCCCDCELFDWGFLVAEELLLAGWWLTVGLDSSSSIEIIKSLVLWLPDLSLAITVNV